MSTESGPGVKEGKVLKGEGGYYPSLRAPTLRLPNPTACYKILLILLESVFEKCPCRGGEPLEERKVAT